MDLTYYKDYVTNDSISKRVIQIVYVLKLENNKFYVGYTRNFNRRMFEHMSNYRSAFCLSQYRPLALDFLIIGDRYIEREIYNKYCDLHGCLNVSMGIEFEEE